LPAPAAEGRVAAYLKAAHGLTTLQQTPAGLTAGGCFVCLAIIRPTYNLIPMDSHPDQTATTHPAQSGHISKLGAGQYGLAKTFWLYLLLSSIALTLVKTMMASAGGGQITLTALAIPTAFLWYQSVAVIGTWRAATNYAGPKVWAVLAKCVSGLLIALIVIQLLSLTAAILQLLF
jgi:hypothetical protein